MTTLHMLQVCKEGYNKTLTKLEKRRDHLTDKYYNLSDVPSEVISEITDLNQDIDKCAKIIADIDNAINVIEYTCNEDENCHDNENTNID